MHTHIFKYVICHNLITYNWKTHCEEKFKILGIPEHVTMNEHHFNVCSTMERYFQLHTLFRVNMYFMRNVDFA